MAQKDVIFYIRFYKQRIGTGSVLNPLWYDPGYILIRILKSFSG